MKKLKNIIKPYSLETLKEIHRCVNTDIVGANVFVSEMSHAMRIRTGQRGEDAH